MIANYSYAFALLCSSLWFAAAFRYFSFQHKAAAKVFIPKSARQSPLFETTAALTRFLGGMNSALALLSFILLFIWFSGVPLFEDPVERGVILMVLATAHFSQFIFNVPILKNGERKGEAFWYVLSGPMLFIFVMDACQAIINFAAGAAQFTL